MVQVFNLVFVITVWSQKVVCKRDERILRRQAVFRATPLFEHERGDRVVRKSDAARHTSSPHFVVYTSSKPSLAQSSTNHKSQITNSNDRFWLGFNCNRALDPLEQIFSGYPFVDGYGLKDTVQGADTERRMCWNHDPVMTWHLGLEDDMATDLMDERIPPQTAKVAG